MFDFNWSEIALIGVVALVLIGPKDLPIAIRAIMAEVKSSFDEIRSMNLKGTIRRTLDPDGTLNRAFEDPFRDHPVKPVMTPKDQTIAVPTSPAPALAAPSFVPPDAAAPAPAPAPLPEQVPSFIPPGAVKPHPTDL
jgi:sec-independent protein translocase protein TatB